MKKFWTDILAAADRSDPAPLPWHSSEPNTSACNGRTE